MFPTKTFSRLLPRKNLFNLLFSLVLAIGFHRLFETHGVWLLLYSFVSRLPMEYLGPLPRDQRPDLYYPFALLCALVVFLGFFFTATYLDRRSQSEPATYEPKPSRSKKRS